MPGQSDPHVIRADWSRKPVTARLHPLSGGLLIFIDNLFFGVDAVSMGLALPVVCLLAFTVTTAGVYLIQRRRHQDRRWVAGVKALIAGILAGVPTSIAGTVFGSAVLFLSGISAWKGRSRL
ncbi:MAG TPA: hypothetical protein VK968_03200 [Roseimicrobium sp.]|nr:hypothetical protein [Roseimicrobium sp.]